MEKTAELAGAKVATDVRNDTDYLVVGDLSPPQWVYASYGRKIEAALLNQKQGRKTQIVREGQYLEALQSLKL